VPLNFRETRATTRRAPESKPHKTLILAERVGSAIATPRYTDPEQHIPEKLRELNEAFR
jgi:hypothetical protein